MLRWLPKPPTVTSHDDLDKSGMVVPDMLRPLIDDPWYLHLFRTHWHAKKELEHPQGAHTARLLRVQRAETRYRMYLLELGQGLIGAERLDAWWFAMNRVTPSDAAWGRSEN